MNQATMALPRINASQNPAGSTTQIEFSVRAFDHGCADLETIFATGHSGFSCSPHWVKTWSRFVNPNILIVTAKKNGQTVLALPLEIVPKFGLKKVVQFVGGSHANANFPAMRTQLSPAEAQQFLSHLNHVLKAAPWAVDAIMLERQLTELNGIPNPLLENGSSISPNVSLHLRVDQSFDAVLETRSAKRKRKRYRSQQRKFEACGGFAILNPCEKHEVEPLLDNYFSMKAQQLQGKGVANVFGDPKEQLFFKALFADKNQQTDHKFHLSGLNVGGKIRTVYGWSMHGTRQMVHFTAFADDELTTASPGDFLNFSMIEAACNGPTEIYDLGVGDEGYKRSWCDVETWHRDTIIGVSLRGKLAKLQFDGTRSVKRWIKNNETLWAIAKRLRKLKTGQKPASQQNAAADDGSDL